MKTMYDAAVPQPRNAVSAFDVAGGYIGSPGATPHVWSNSDWESQPARYRLPIYVPSVFRDGVWNVSGDVDECHAALNSIGVPLGCTIGLDFETKINPSYVSAFSAMLRDAGYFTIIYGSTSTLFQNPPMSMGYWPADITDKPHFMSHPDVLATQYGSISGNGVDLDLDVLSDDVPVWDTVTGESSIMPTIPASIAQRWPDLAPDFPAGQSFDIATAAIYADARAQEALNQIAKLQTQVSSLTLGGGSLTVTPADIQAIAVAVAKELGKDLANG